MKKNYLLGLSLVTAVGFLAFQRTGNWEVEKFLEKNAHILNANGAPAGRTGAPGETNCTECHAGSSQSGLGVNSLYMLDGATIVTNYTPGQSYNMTLSLAIGDVKEGFQSTVLDLAGTNFVGDFPGTGGFGTQVFSASGRKYATHTSTSNSEGNTAWVWTWDAPATDAGPIKFYVATNVANGNSNTSGDVIYLSEHTFGSTASLEEVEEDLTDFTAGYSPASHAIQLNFSSKTVDRMFLNLVDMNGKSVFTDNPGNSQLGSNSFNVTLPGDLNPGMYVVNLFVGNKAMKANVLVQR